jgi:hypothetical protein
VSFGARTSPSRISSEDALQSVATSLWQTNTCATFVRAPSALDHEKVLPEFVRYALHLEIFRHGRY